MEKRDMSYFTFSEVEVVLDLSDTNLWLSCATIFFNPLYWNCVSFYDNLYLNIYREVTVQVSRYEYKTRKISRKIGSPRLSVYMFGMSIFLLGLYRDWRYKVAMNTQPEWDLLQNDTSQYIGWGLLFLGNVLVWTSYWRLGFIGTFCGDYFGIFLDDVVSGFPYNVVDNPMYVGSTLNFLGGGFVYSSQAGILLGILAGVVYLVATRLEEPFTDMVYKSRVIVQKNGKAH